MDANLQKLESYVAGVMDGSILVGKWVRLAVERHLRDVKNPELFFDAAAASRACRFFGLLRHSKGEHAGEPFELSPWQCFVVGSVFGWKLRATGRRRFRTAYNEICRKNGKSTLAAGVGLLCLIGDDEPGPEVYSLATKRDQAHIVFDEAAKMVKASPSLRKATKRRRGSLIYDAANGKFQPLGRDADSLDGLNVSCGIIDELHAIKHRELVEVIDSATGARRNPLLFMITTAGARPEGICHEQRQYCEKILEQTHTDDGVFAFIACIDAKDDPLDEAVWPKANPNLGVSVNVEQLRAISKKAKEQPTARASFARYHAGVWCETVERWIEGETWRACQQKFSEEDLRGGLCYGGLDLAGTLDLSSLVLVFPRETGCRVLCYSWAPKENAHKRQRVDRAPYVTWADAGWLRLTESATTDQAEIFRDIEQLNKKFLIKQIAFDRFAAAMLENPVKSLGIEPVALPMTFTGLGIPTRETERLIIGKELEHDGNPLLTWAIGNVACDTDSNGNFKPNKVKSRERIDPAVALICAVASWKFGQAEQMPVSDYGGKGILFL